VNQRATQAQIYRRRRIILLAFVALIGYLIYLAVAAIGAMFTPKPVVATSSNCKPGVVSVTAFAGDGTDHLTVFDAKTNPLVWFSVVNTGKKACTFNVGPAVQFFTIKSGDQLIWTSKQCNRVGLTDQQMVLQPNKAKLSPPSEWLRVYSSGGGCGKGQAPALPGSYTLSVEVNKVMSSNYEQFEIQ